MGPMHADEPAIDAGLVRRLVRGQFPCCGGPAGHSPGLGRHGQRRVPARQRPHGPAGPPRWVHSDLMPSNLLLRDGHLTGVLDWRPRAAAAGTELGCHPKP
jgi:hypothetical protein